MQIDRLRLRLWVVSWTFIGFLALAAYSQELTSQTAMHARVHSVYDFSPSQVTNAVRANKSKEMDSFWTDVTSHKEAALPLLRVELEDPKNPPFFLFDGSALLLSLSKSSDDQKIVVAAIARTDLKDVTRRSYLDQVHALAINGTNVTPAALHILDDPKFEVFLPKHGAYRLDQPMCLLEALLPLPTETWLPAIIDRLKTEADLQGRKSLLLLLFYAQTDEADRLIRSTAKKVGEPQETRDFANSILDHERKLGIGSHPSPTTESQLREERRKRMFGMSDEAIDDMDQLTEKIAKARTLSR